MSMEPNKTPKAPTFLGAIIPIFGGMIFLAAGLGLFLIKAPYYYPGALWYTISVVYMMIGSITLGLSYRRLRRFLTYVGTPPVETQTETEQPETLAERRP